VGWGQLKFLHKNLFICINQIQNFLPGVVRFYSWVLKAERKRVEERCATREVAMGRGGEAKPRECGGDGGMRR
jgi:hypothetical protein